MSIRKDENGNYVLVVNGEEKTLSESQLLEEITKVQKSQAAEKKFEEAAALRKEAEEEAAKAKESISGYQKKLRELYVKADTEFAPDSYKEFLELQGYSPKEVAHKVQQYQYIHEVANQEEEDGDEEPEKRQHSQRRASRPEPPAPPKKLAWDDLPPEVQQELAEARKYRHERLRTEAFQELQETLEKDKLLSKVFSEGGPKAERLKKLAQGELKSRLAAGTEYGPKLLSDVAVGIKSIAEEFGVGKSSTSVPGLGLAPGVGPTEIQAEEPPEATSPIFDPEYVDKFVQRAAFAAAGKT